MMDTFEVFQDHFSDTLDVFQGPFLVGVMDCCRFTMGESPVHESDTNVLDIVDSSKLDGLVGAVSIDDLGALISFIGF